MPLVPSRRYLLSYKNSQQDGTRVDGEQVDRGEHCVPRYRDTISKVPVDGLQVRMIQFIGDFSLE